MEKFGKLTWEALNSNYERPRVLYPQYLICKGQQGEDVRKVQAQLIAKGYNCGKFGADSIFGRSTEDAVKKFQKANGLNVDGIVGPLTWEELF